MSEKASNEDITNIFFPKYFHEDSKVVDMMKQGRNGQLKLTLSPARILNDCMTCSAVSVSVVSRVMKSRKASNVT